MATISSVPLTSATDAPTRKDPSRQPDERSDDSATAALIAIGPVAGRLFAEASLTSTVAAVTTLAQETVAADCVGVLVAGVNGSLDLLGASSSDAAGADRLQVSQGQGPALGATDRRQPVIVTDLRSESRWRFWAPRAADLGLRSVLSVPLANGDLTGALTFYSRTTSRFLSRDLASAAVFARLSAIAITVAQEREQLIEAAKSRAVIGQAQGMLMERYGVTAAQAFTVLQRYSSHLNIKLRIVAADLLRDGHLPEADQTPP
jgi:GAF domain-containing protein